MNLKTRNKLHDIFLREGFDGLMEEVVSKTDAREKIEGMKTTNEYWMEKLDVPSSDYSFGHMRGYNQSLIDILEKLEL